MIDGTAGPSLKDVKPIRLHWAVILMASVWGGFLFAVHKSALGDDFKFLLGMLAPAVLMLYIYVLGGPKKLFMDWFACNFWGYYWVLRRTGQNTFAGEVVNARNREYAARGEWAIYLPIGGWFNRPYFRYGNQSPLGTLVITRVRREWLEDFAEITVQDHIGNRLSHHPAWFLERLSQLLPRELPFGAEALHRLMTTDAERLEVAKKVVEQERDEARASWKKASAVACGELGVLTKVLRIAESSTRLRTTREGRKIYDLVAYEVNCIKFSMSHWLHPEVRLDDKKPSA
ncbi:MAG: hypothetical protein IT405_01905 [Candidatus Yanofskybacteria bacterium]|nr:hypothetical protein [Candidatus Yanofskybacteria bacterium]